MKIFQLLKPLGAAIILVLLLATGLSPSIWMLWEHIRYMQFEKEARSDLQTNIWAEKAVNTTTHERTLYTIVSQNQTNVTVPVPVPTYQETSSSSTEYPLLAGSTTFTISINAPSFVTASAILLIISGTLLDKLLEAYVSLTYKGVAVNIQNPIIFTILGIGILAFFAA